MDKLTCAIEGCGKRVMARGWCKTHYDRWNRTGSTELEKDRRPPLCATEGCGRPNESRGYCRKHYSAKRRAGEIIVANPQVCSFKGCEKDMMARGLCSSHYRQIRTKGELSELSGIAVPLMERFWSRVDKNGPTVPGHPEMGQCWQWTAGTTGKNGDYPYGLISVNGKSTLAHRVSYEAHHGKLPDGALVDHECHNTLCVNPSHLREASRSENNAYFIGPRVNNRNTGVRNVYLNRRNGRSPYFVSVKGRYFGAYSTVEEAEQVAKGARAEMFEFPDF